MGQAGQSGKQRQRSCEILHNGCDVPLKYGACQMRWLIRTVWIVPCKTARMEIVLTWFSSVRIKFIIRLSSDDRKEPPNLCGARYLNAAKVMEIYGQSKRHIWKARFALTMKINRRLLKLLDVEEKRKTNLSMKLVGQEKRFLKKLSIEYGKETSNQMR